MQELKTGEALLNFRGTLRSRATEAHYLFLLQRYAAFRKTLDLEDIIEQDSKSQKMAVAYIREFLLSLQVGAKLSAGSISNYRLALKHFYDMNDIALNWKKIAKFARMEDTNGGIKEKDRAYTRQEIQTILQHAASPKVRAIILLMASSGIRVGAIQYLRMKHLTKVPFASESVKEGDQQHQYYCYQFLIYPGHKEEYITFCTPEAAQAIDSYLAFRTRAGEKLDQHSPVFRTDFYPTDLFKVRNAIKPMTTVGISKAMYSALKAAGLFTTPVTTESDDESGRNRRHEVQRNHGFRKFANTQMVLANVNGAAKEMLLGHSIGLDDRYYRPTTQQLFDEYAKTIDQLTINEENRLRRKVDACSEKLESEKQKENRISVLEKQMHSLVSTLSKLTEQRQVNTVAQTLYSSGILKEGAVEATEK